MTKFDLLMNELGLQRSTPRTVELLLEEDLPARIILHPSNECIVIPLYFYDISEVDKVVRSGIYESLLLLNDFSVQQSLCYVGLDDQGLLALIGVVSLRELTEEDFLARLSLLEQQARRYRELVEAMAELAVD